MKEAYTKTDGVDHPLKAVLFLASPVSPLSSSGCTEDVRRDLGTMADRRSSTAPPLPPDPFACCCRVLRWGDSISGAFHLDSFGSNKGPIPIGEFHEGDLARRKRPRRYWDCGSCVCR